MSIGIDIIKYINLTPHALNLGDDTVEPSGYIRVSFTEVHCGEVNGLEVVRNDNPVLEGLPAPVDGVVYVVSAMVLAQCADRSDVYAPDTGSTAVRNEKGHIVKVTRLVTAYVE